jgi:hypothetical protein
MVLHSTLIPLDNCYFLKEHTNITCRAWRNKIPLLNEVSTIIRHTYLILYTERWSACMLHAMVQGMHAVKHIAAVYVLTLATSHVPTQDSRTCYVTLPAMLHNMSGCITYRMQLSRLNGALQVNVPPTMSQEVQTKLEHAWTRGSRDSRVGANSRDCDREPVWCVDQGSFGLSRNILVPPFSQSLGGTQI